MRPVVNRQPGYRLGDSLGRLGSAQKSEISEKSTTPLFCKHAIPGKTVALTRMQDAMLGPGFARSVTPDPRSQHKRIYVLPLIYLDPAVNRQLGFRRGDT